MNFKIKAKVVLVAGGLVSLLAGCQGVKPESDEVSRHSPPVIVALDSMGQYFQNEVTVLHVTQHVSGGESPTATIVTIEESGLLDDSISAKRTVFSMVKKDGQWEIKNQIKTQKCYPGRGHQDFSNYLCL